MFRTDYELSEMIAARRQDLSRSARRPATTPVAGAASGTALRRWRRTVGQRVVTLGTALIG